MAATSGSRPVVIVGGFAGLFAARALRRAPVQAPPLAEAVAKATGAEQDRAGRLLCGKDLSLPDHPDILVTGDMMCLDKLPGVAETAMQTGLYAARRITQEAQGHAYDKPFRTATWARPPTSPAGTPSSRSASCTSAVFLAGVPGCSSTSASSPASATASAPS